MASADSTIISIQRTFPVEFSSIYPKETLKSDPHLLNSARFSNRTGNVMPSPMIPTHRWHSYFIFGLAIFTSIVITIGVLIVCFTSPKAPSMYILLLIFNLLSSQNDWHRFVRNILNFRVENSQNSIKM